MKVNNKGFSAVGVLLVIVVLVLIAGAGYWVYQNNQSDSAQNTDTTEQQETAETADQTADEAEPVDETADWTSFTPNSKTYTVKLPDGWTFQHQNDQCDCIFADDMTYEEGVPAAIETVQGGRDGIYSYFIAVDDVDVSDARFSNAKKVGDFKAGDLVGTKYMHETTEEPEGIGPPAGSTTYQYYIPKGDKYIYASYTALPGQENQLELVEKSLKTLE